MYNTVIINGSLVVRHTETSESHYQDCTRLRNASKQYREYSLPTSVRGHSTEYRQLGECTEEDPHPPKRTSTVVRAYPVSVG